MTQKTAHQIQSDVWRLLKASALASTISGGVYRAGMRPPASDKEDAVVIFTAGDTGQVQEGVVTINIFVPDLHPYADCGVSVEDGARLEQVEAAAQQWADSLTAKTTGDYRFELQQTIATDKADGAHQHFVVVRLAFRHFNG